MPFHGPTLQVCKISGRAENPKLGRFNNYQLLYAPVRTGSNRLKNIQIQCEPVHILEKNALKVNRC